MASRYTQSRTCRPLQAQKAKKRPPGPGGQRVPAPQDEDPRVKCRDCGAFGHKASSVRCPMKRWQGALAPQPLGCRLGKENLEQKLQVLQTLRTCNLAEKENKQRPRQAEQQQKLLQRLPGRPQGQQWCWKEVTESCDYVRHPHRPMLIQPSKRKSLLELDQTSRPPVRKDDLKSTQPSVSLSKKSLVQHPHSSIQAPGKRSAQSSNQPCLHPPKKPRLSPVPPPRKNSLTSDLGPFQHLHHPCSTTGHGTTVKPHVTRKTLAQMPGPAPQPPLSRSVSSAIQACTLAHPQPTSLIPGQPLKMLFRRTGKGWWSCRYMGPPLPPPAEKPAPTALSPPVYRESECPRTTGSWSALYEDMQVPSSSEESDWEGDTHGQMPPPPPPAEKSAPPALSPTVYSKSECPRTPRSWSVLYEDLQVSSSSEESDWDGDTHGQMPPPPPPAEKPAPPSLSPPVYRESECPRTPGSWYVLHEGLQVSSSSEESDWEGHTHGH